MRRTIISFGSSSTSDKWNLRRYVNPWPDLSRIADDSILTARVDSYATSFGIVSAVMCSMSASALANVPAVPKQGDPQVNSSYLADFGVTSPVVAHDLYLSACIASIYTGMSAVGMSLCSSKVFGKCYLGW